ncbi:hypothetical protein PR048_004161 [Dryococelus australis]|uniref:DDE-1 domain-containing protein n=1 Tax=Dryococelus australis TaxID=614101 RepID=A0ABQ9I4Q5_9NEOP|nr:hypothetical protein PR048_004161 [Dryococelus australis]
MCLLPPHCTHKMQPLDKTFMGPLKMYYIEEIRSVFATMTTLLLNMVDKTLFKPNDNRIREMKCNRTKEMHYNRTREMKCNRTREMQWSKWLNKQDL